jgi:phosphotransferase system HPr-like phosphotransfer protein
MILSAIFKTLRDRLGRFQSQIMVNMGNERISAKGVVRIMLLRWRAFQTEI